jgi:hypothetical protein
MLPDRSSMVVEGISSNVAWLNPSQ